MRWRAAILIVACGVCIPGPDRSAHLVAAGPTRQAAVRARTVYMSVVGDRARSALDLRPADFEVKEDGKTRRVIEVSRSTLPLRVAVILNDKGSDINEIRRGLATVLQRLQDTAEVSLVSAAPTVVRVFDYTASGPAMLAGVQRLVWRSGPSTGMLLNVIADAADELGQREDTRSAIVVVHFEGDELQNHKPSADVLAAVQRSHAVLHVVAVGTPRLRRMAKAPTEDAQGDEWTVDEQNRNAVLGEGPRQSGGRRQELTAATGLAKALATVADDLLNQYALVYEGAAESRTARKLSVSAKRKGLSVLAPARIEG